MRQVISDTLLIWVASQNYLDDLDIPDSLEDVISHFKFCEHRYSNNRLEINTPEGPQTTDTSPLLSINDPGIFRSSEAG